MSSLTPTARAILTHLRDQPADAATLRDATHRSLTTIEKTLTDLTHRGLTAHHPGDDGTDKWMLTDTGRASIDTPSTDEAGTDADNALTDADNGETDAGTDSPPDSVNDGTTADEPGDGPANGDDQLSHADGSADGPEQPDDTQNGSASTADGDHEPADAEPDDAPAPAKHCRGCQKELPPMCPTCWQKTPLYCGQCRRALPVGRRGAPSEPEILANGLRKLMPGELEKLVLDVFANHPVPNFQGIVGWNPGRIAIHLPGRSTGAINRVLDKLTGTGQVELINASPKYYRPVLDTPARPSDEPNPEHPSGGDNGPLDRTEPNTGDNGDTGDNQHDQQRGEQDHERQHDQ
ncbi:MAG TPA: hypothetical protein VI248_19290 [Kineosporiaceae bacterium]